MVSTYQVKNEQKKAIGSDDEFNDAINDINRNFAEKKAMASAQQTGFPYIDIQNAIINPDLALKINLEDAKKSLALPFFVIGKKMRIAVVDPEKKETKEYLEKIKKDNYQVQVNLCSQLGLLKKIEYIHSIQPSKDEIIENKNAEIDIKSYEEEIKNLQSLEQEAEQITAQEALNRIFVGALRTEASDIHFQPEESQVVIRFRIDGVLQKIISLEKKVGHSITDQLKYESKLRLNIENLPQDGRTDFLASDRKIDLRVSTLPTEYGESIVCRLLDSEKKIHDFEELGFTNKTLTELKQATSLRSGMILVTGPTGSGKTTTLYTILGKLNSEELKIATLENPIEYHLKNIVQSQIDEDHEYTFADGIKALLRQDPDVLMVGEIRDKKTAVAAAQSAMTGHVVLSTLHTNSAVEAIPRLLDLDIKPFVLASSLNLVVAQRLIRRPCLQCSKKVKPNEQQIKFIKNQLSEIKKRNNTIKSEVPDFLWETHGCLACCHSGYRGQIVIAESFQIDEKIRNLIIAGTPASTITNHARKSQGMISFAEDGLLKVCDGLSTLEEVIRITDLKINS